MNNFVKLNTAYFTFNLTEASKTFCATVCQDGPRLERSRPEEREDVYKPNIYSMILIDGDNNIVGQTAQKSS